MIDPRLRSKLPMCCNFIACKNGAEMSHSVSFLSQRLAFFAAGKAVHSLEAVGCAGDQTPSGFSRVAGAGDPSSPASSGAVVTQAKGGIGVVASTHERRAHVLADRARLPAEPGSRCGAFCGGRGTRTPKPFRAADFKSADLPLA